MSVISMLIQPKVVYIPLLVYFVVRVLWKWILYPKHFSPLRRLPQAPVCTSPDSSLVKLTNPSTGGSYLTGQFLNELTGNPGEMMRHWANEVPTDGLIRYLDIFNIERVIVVTPKALADVLVHNNYNFEKPAPLRKGISRILGMGLFLAEGDTHKTQRKNLMPAFSFRHVKDLYPVFWAKSMELVDTISAQAQQSGVFEVEVNGWASRATLDIIGLAGMGYDFQALSQSDNDLLRTYKSLFSPGVAGRLLALAGLFLPAWFVRALPFKRNSDINHASDVIKAHCRSLIANKKNRKNKIQQEEKVASGDELDILEVALQSGGFTDEELVDQLMTFLVAGHETSASALTWIIYLLCKHPDVQAKLRKEIYSLITADGKSTSVPLTPLNIDDLPYLAAVINETLRLYPPVALTVRVCVKDTIVAGEHIPKGTNVMLPPWAVNASYDLWGENALEFIPERWLETSKGSEIRSNFSFMTFLHGPRSCIGERFARAELAYLVIAWVTTFETKLVDENFTPLIRGGITAKPKGGLPVEIRLLK